MDAKCLVRCVLVSISAWTVCAPATASSEHHATPAPRVVAAAVEQAAPYGPQRRGSLGKPEGLAPITAEAPLLPGPAYERRSLELDVAVTANHRLCPRGLDRCQNQPGIGFQAAALHRVGPFLGWGLQAELAGWKEHFEYRTLKAQMNARTMSALLVARLGFLRHGIFDPYIQAGAGAGRYQLDGSVSSDRESWQHSESTWAPIYQAAFGLDIHVSQSFRVGGNFSWTHWLLEDFERCNEVVTGACTLPQPGMFDLDNAVWSFGLKASFVFGQTH